MIWLRTNRYWEGLQLKEQEFKRKYQIFHEVEPEDQVQEEETKDETDI